VTVDIHFVQGGEAPVLAGPGSETLSCACGQTLISGYNSRNFLGVGLQCGRCGVVTTTPGMEAGRIPPSAVIMAEPSATPRHESMTVPTGAAVIGRAEMERLRALFRPVAPKSNIYRFSAERLDEASAAYEQYVGEALPVVGAMADVPLNGSANSALHGSANTALLGLANSAFDGFKAHPLGWAVGHLRSRMASGAWRCSEDEPTANASVHVAGFLHFVATWSHHPAFTAMVATAAERGFGLHGLAPFAAAHVLTMMGNQTSFPAPTGYPGRIEGLSLVTGPAASMPVHVEVFDRFEYPFGRPWDHIGLRSAVTELLTAAQGRINVRNPGLLLLSPGVTLAGFDEALIQAINHAMLSVGRKNRGLMAVAPIVLRHLPTPDPHAIQFGYGLFPVANRHYRGEAQLRSGG
jgi:hypothetical protein